MPKKVKVWRAPDGLLYHDQCFEEGESREEFKSVSLDDLSTDDECESCGGSFVTGPEADDDDDDDDEADD